MDSINTLKGYGKVGHIEEPRKKQKRFIIISIIIAAALLLTILLCYTSSAYTHHRKTTTTPTPNYISTVCNHTTHPTICVSSLENSTATADPEQLVKLSLQVSLRHLLNLSSVPVPSPDPRLAPALRDCKSLIADSIDGVNASISVMEVEDGEKMLTLMKINDIQTWVSAAMTNLETCVDGLKEVGGGEALWNSKEVVSGVEDCEVYLSIGLGIIAKIALILDELHIPLH